VAFFYTSCSAYGAAINKGEDVDGGLHHAYVLYSSILTQVSLVILPMGVLRSCDCITVFYVVRRHNIPGCLHEFVYRQLFCFLF
jgi:hypothetical protein